mmetsp:Transcript_45087/g.70672  ORF Transcript_45087/g.70672 Transcript_45087/m.70672 type:complete len:206 (-) Transcript_45087:1158-1775(-)
MGPFFVVLIFYCAAFFHALWALSDKSVADIAVLTFRLGILSDFTLREGDELGSESILDGETMTAWLLAWFFFCSCLLTLFMMNVVIGILPPVPCISFLGLPQRHRIDVSLVEFAVQSRILDPTLYALYAGVLGESYDVEQDRAIVAFLRERASLVFKYSLRIYKVDRPLPLYNKLTDVAALWEESSLKAIGATILYLPLVLVYSA